MILQHINDIASICAGHGVTTAIISPGSRSAPLTLAFSRHPEIDTKVIADERSAAFIAMGMAQQQKRPVVLICTSGSAAYNYAPAIAEAYYQEIPLLVLTADRPPEWTNQYDGQTIMQSGIYGKHVKSSADFPVEITGKDIEWHCNRLVNEALLCSMSSPKGPSHINIPFREPFYPEKGESIEFPEVRIIKAPSVENSLPTNEWDLLEEVWEKATQKLIAVGQTDRSDELTAALKAFSEKTGTPVVSDIISNQHELAEVIQHQDAFLNSNLDDRNAELAPDLLITFGKSFISKNLKRFLRKHKPQHHWHIQASERLNDSLQHLTRLIRMEPTEFFKRFSAGAESKDFKEKWQSLNQSTKQQTTEFLAEGPFSEFKAVESAINALPENSQLHLANSMTVRYANFLGLDRGKEISVFANRGTSGIDGSNSTAVGAALAQDKIVTLITGDMAFLYDRNAFWHNYDLKNLRVIILNNHAGGIFRLIEGPANRPELEKYFETHQVLTAENTCRDFGFQYQQVNTQKELMEALSKFFIPSEQAKLIEIETSSVKNAEIFKNFKKRIIEKI